MQLIFGTRSFTWWQKRSHWCFVSTVIWWFLLDFLYICTFFKEILLSSFPYCVSFSWDKVTKLCLLASHRNPPIFVLYMARVIGTWSYPALWVLGIWTQVLILAQCAFLHAEPSPQPYAVIFLSEQKGLFWWFPLYHFWRLNFGLSWKIIFHGLEGRQSGIWTFKVNYYRCFNT